MYTARGNSKQFKYIQQLFENTAHLLRKCLNSRHGLNDRFYLFHQVSNIAIQTGPVLFLFTRTKQGSKLRLIQSPISTEFHGSVTAQNIRSPDYELCHLHYTNWRLKICIWRLYFSSWSLKGDLGIFLILSPD